MPVRACGEPKRLVDGVLLGEKTPFLDLPDLETQRLRIRRLTMRDAEDIYAYSRDPLVAKHVLWDAQRHVGEAKSYIRAQIRKYRSGEPASWGIELKETGRVIGTIGYMWWQPDNSTVEVGYSLAREYWGKGIMTEALREVLRYTFSTLRMHRVEAQYETDNAASGRVMEKCGMRHEGTLRGRLFNKGRYVDVELYGMLAEDYNKVKPSAV